MSSRVSSVAICAWLESLLPHRCVRSAIGCFVLSLFAFSLFGCLHLGYTAHHCAFCRIIRELTCRSSAMGKSRSAAVCIAYLLHQKPNVLTPQSALEILRQSRPLCEPNDGFMEQLALYHEMGCPDDVTEHPVYQRWLYRRDVEESVACGRAPEMRSVRFEDEQPTRPKEKAAQEVEIKCRKCRFVSIPISKDLLRRPSPLIEFRPKYTDCTLTERDLQHLHISFPTRKKKETALRCGQTRNARMSFYIP